MNKFFWLSIILAFGCLFSACNQDVSVGANLIGDQPIEADFNSEIDITARTVNGVTRFIGYRNRGDFNRGLYLLGELDDPINLIIEE